MSQPLDDYERDVIVEMLNHYRDLRCLWDARSEVHRNKKSRNEAFRSLLEIYKKINATATLDITKRKIENMRNAYRRELRKVKAFEISGHVYRPRLWYFQYMNFLVERDCAKNSVEYKKDDALCKENYIENEAAHEVISLATETAETQPLSPVARDRSHLLIQEKEQKGTDSAEVPISVEEDDWDVISWSWAVQMRQLDEHQQTIAEKLISEIMFYGKRGLLTDYSSVSVAPRTFSRFVCRNPKTKGNSSWVGQHHAFPHSYSLPQSSSGVSCPLCSSLSSPTQFAPRRTYSKSCPLNRNQLLQFNNNLTF